MKDTLRRFPIASESRMPNPGARHKIPASEELEIRGIVVVTLVAALAGVVVGVVGGAFAWALSAWFDRALALVAWLRREGAQLPVPGVCIAVALAAALAALARLLVRFAPSAAGSGIQHVEAVMRGDAQPAPLGVLPVKFFGGLFAMSSGLLLGREGPTVQMAAVIGNSCASLFRLSAEDRAMLYTAVAGAGLAVAFNAPLAGAAFVIEEVARTVSLRRMTVTLTAVGTSVFVFRLIFGNAPQFVVHDIHLTGTTELCLMTLLGAALGLGGALYNRTVLFFLEAADRLRKVPPEVRAGAIGALVAIAGWVDLRWIGSGELQVQSILDGNLALGSIAMLFLVRWILGPLSYAGGTPGGLFAPLLLLGASAGALFAGTSNLFVAGAAGQAAFAIVGMAALFAGVVRAPLTGVLLIVEMTQSVTLLAPLLLASVAAVVVSSVLRSPPIYDTLRERMTLAGAGPNSGAGQVSERPGAG